MRHLIHLVWLLPLLGAAALGADDLPQPKKDPILPAPMPDLPPPRALAGQSEADAELKRLLQQLRSQREALHSERGGEREAESSPPTANNDEEIARLRKRMEELARRRASRKAEEAVPGETRPLDPLLALPRESEAARGSAIDPSAVAQNYFRAGDWEAALEAYRKLPTRGLLAEERAPLVYMLATCYRRLGKRDEATKLYREAAGIKDDQFVADCARWQLETLAWRKTLEAQLAQLRERRRTLGPRP
jgi:tetratricopeptide (TPR) repeat protein